MQGSRHHRPTVRRLGVLVGSAALLLAAAAVAELAPLAPQPAGLAWPTKEWPGGPLPADLDRGVFEANVGKLFEGRGRGGYADTRALLVVQDGRLVFERYAEGFGPESRFQSWSMAKAATNALIGILVRAQRLALDAPAAVPAWRAEGDPRGAITLRHLIQMRSGLDNADGFGIGGGGNGIDMFVSRLLFGEGSRAPAAYAANVDLIHPVGEHWAYSTGSSILLAKIAGDEIGGGAVGTRDFLRRELFDRIGMRSAQPEFAASGEFLGGAFVHATARDWARFGYLYLRDGVWEGERVLPEGWVDFSRTPNPAKNNQVHGAQFWINVGAPADGQWPPLPGGPDTVFLTEGAGFQVVAMDPARDLVAVRLGMDQGVPYPELKTPFGPMMAAFGERGVR